MHKKCGHYYNHYYASVGGATRHTVVRLFVCHYAEGGAIEVYCNRAVCPSVILSDQAESRRSLKNKR